MSILKGRLFRIKLITFVCVAVVSCSYSAGLKQLNQVSYPEACIPVYKNTDYSCIYYPSPALLPEPFVIKSEVEHGIDESAKDMMPRPANYHRSSGILTAVIATATFHYLAGLCC